MHRKCSAAKNRFVRIFFQITMFRPNALFVNEYSLCISIFFYSSQEMERTRGRIYFHNRSSRHERGTNGMAAATGWIEFVAKVKIWRNKILPTISVSPTVQTLSPLPSGRFDFKRYLLIISVYNNPYYVLFEFLNTSFTRIIQYMGHKSIFLPVCPDYFYKFSNESILWSTPKSNRVYTPISVNNRIIISHGIRTRMTQNVFWFLSSQQIYNIFTAIKLTIFAFRFSIR